MRVLILFFFIYNPKLFGLPISSAKIVLLLSAAYCFFAKIQLPRRLTNLAFNSVAIGLMAILIFATVIFIHGTGDYSLTYSFFIMLVEAYLGSLLLVLLFFQRTNLSEFSGFLVSMGVLQSFIIIAMLLIPDFREFIFLLTDDRGRDVFERYGGFRGLGVSSSVAFDLSTSLCLSQLFLLHEYLTKKKFSVIKFLTFWTLMFFAIAITGRTGLIFSILGFLILILPMANSRKIFKLNAYAVLLAAVLGSFIITEFERVLGDRYADITNYWMELFAEEGTQSVSNVMETVNIPDLGTFIHGFGKYTFELGDPRYTDVGYLRHFNYIGIFGLLMIMLFYLYNYAEIFRTIKVSSKVTRRFLFCIFMFPFFWNLKGDILIGSGLNIKICFLTLFILYLKENIDASKVGRKSNSPGIPN